MDRDDETAIRVLPDGTVRIDAILTPCLVVTLTELVSCLVARGERFPAAFLASIWPRLTESLRELFFRGHTHGAISFETILVNSFGGAWFLQAPGAHARLPSVSAASSDAAAADVFALGTVFLACCGELPIGGSVDEAINFLLESPREAVSLIMTRSLSTPTAAPGARYDPFCGATESSRIDDLIDVDAFADALRASSPLPPGSFRSPPSTWTAPTTATGTPAAVGEARRVLMRTPPSVTHAVGGEGGGGGGGEGRGEGRGEGCDLGKSPVPPQPPKSPTKALPPSLPPHRNSPIASATVLANTSRAEELQRMRAAKQAAAKSVAAGGDAGAIAFEGGGSAAEALLAAARKDAFAARLALKARHDGAGGGAVVVVGGSAGSANIASRSSGKGMQRTPPHSTLSDGAFSAGAGPDAVRLRSPLALSSPLMQQEEALTAPQASSPPRVNNAEAKKALRRALDMERENDLRLARIAAHAERSALAIRAAQVLSASGDEQLRGVGARASSASSKHTLSAAAAPPSPPQAAQRSLPQTPLVLRAAKQAEKAAAEEEMLRIARIDAFKERQALKERFGR